MVNTEKIKDGSKRDLAFGLEIGDKKLWTALHTFTIDGIEEVGNDDPTVDNRYYLEGQFFKTVTWQIHMAPKIAHFCPIFSSRTELYKFLVSYGFGKFSKKD